MGKGQLRFQWSGPTLGGGLEQNVWVVRVLSTRAVKNQWSSSGRVVVTRNGAVASSGLGYCASNGQFV